MQKLCAIILISSLAKTSCDCVAPVQEPVLPRFDKVTRNPEYQSIAQLPGFSGVYSTLHKLSDGEQRHSTATKIPSPPEETTRE